MLPTPAGRLRISIDSNHSADNRFTHTHINDPTLLVALTITRLTILTFMLSTPPQHQLPSFTHNLRILEFHSPCSFLAQSRSRMKRLINYITGVTRTSHSRSLSCKITLTAPASRKKNNLLHIKNVSCIYIIKTAFYPSLDKCEPT